MTIYLAVKFRAFGVTFGVCRWRAVFDGAWRVAEVSEGEMAGLGDPVIDARGVRLFVWVDRFGFFEG